MKALFIHDHPFIKNTETSLLYTSGNLNSELWERYLRHFESVTVIGRCKEENNTSRYNRAEKDNVIFKLFDDVKGGVDYFRKRSKIEKKLKEEIQVHDVVIMRFPATISIFAAQYCKKNNIPYIAEVVGCSWDANWNYGGIAPKLIAPYSYFQMKKAVKNAFAGIYVTRFFLQKRYPCNSTIKEAASNVILKSIEEEVLPNRLLKIKKSSDVFHVGIIGNIAVKYKGYDVLLEAIKRLPKELTKKIKISFVGGGDSSYLNSLIEKSGLNSNTLVLGKLKAGEEIFKFLDTLDLYIHPSKQEGLPRVVIEAMSRACPVLASSVAGTPELIDEKYIHTPGDAIKLSRDIRGLINNKEELSKIAKDNFKNSKQYLFDALESRRGAFFESIKNKLKK